MKTLNKSNTSIFCRLIEMMNGDDYLKITSQPLSLALEKIGEDILTPNGKGCAYSLFFFYERLGELFQDLEMCLLFLDNRDDDQADFTKVSIVPFMFQSLCLGILQESIEFNNQVMGKKHTDMQAAHTILANMWIKSIKSRGLVTDK